MTISSTTNRVSYAGNGTTTAFATGFKFYANSDLLVLLVDATTGVETTQTITTHYTVSGAKQDAGGTVTMVTAPPTGNNLVIVRQQPYTQGLDLEENDNMPSASLEEQIDKTVVMAQQNNDNISRSVKLPEGFTTSFDTSLPADINTAGVSLVVNATADGFDKGPDSSDISAAAGNATAAAASATAAAASATAAAASAASAASSAAGAPVWCGTATGTANALVLTPASAITAYETGKIYRFQAGGANNTGATTIAISGLSAVAAELDDTALSAGDIEASKYYSALYDGTALQIERLSEDSALPATVSQAEAEAGTETATRTFTPERVKQAIDALAIPRGHIAGLGMSNGTDTDHDIDIAVGDATADDQTAKITLTSAITKQIDAVWALGTNAGGLDTGSVTTSTTYHVYIIRRSDTGVVDALFSTSATSPTMPTNYDQKRRIGAVLTDGLSNIIGFSQVGDEFLWTDPPLDVNASMGTTAVSRTLSVPSGKVVHAIINVIVIHATDGRVYLSPLDVNDEAPVSGSAPLATIFGNGLGTAWATMSSVRTNTSAQIRSRAALSSTTLQIATLGWIDSRGKDD